MQLIYSIWYIYTVPYFPFKRTYNLNFLKSSQFLANAYQLFCNTYIYSNCSKWHLVNQYKEQLVFCCAAPFFSKILHRCSDAPTEITYVIGLLLLHILLTLAPKRIVQRWKVGEYGGQWCCVLRELIWSQKWQTLCGNVAACSILLKPILFPCCNMLDVLPYCVLQNFLQVNFPIYRSIKPHNRKTPTVNNAHPGHRLFTVSLLAID